MCRGLNELCKTPFGSPLQSGCAELDQRRMALFRIQSSIYPRFDRVESGIFDTQKKLGKTDGCDTNPQEHTQ